MSFGDSSESEPAKRPLELTITVIILGVVLSIVMGAANVYLGLKVGMTVSASIPAAVVATGILRGVMRRSSILESNLVQTAASAGESLAAGIIFTMPAMLVIGAWEEFNYWTTSLIALAGGLLGILLMIPMRRVFIIDNDELRFPEGVACAEVLRAGDRTEPGQANTGLLLVVAGIAIGGILKGLQSLVGLLRGTVEGVLISGRRVHYLGADMSPALVGVGFIVGLPIAFQVFLGGSIGWLIAMPLMEAAPNDTGTDAAWNLWSSQVRYIGVGAMVVGGAASIWKVRNGLVAAIQELATILTGKSDLAKDPTERNLSMGAIAVWSLVSTIAVAGLYYAVLQSASLTLVTTILMFVLSFFMTAVASYIVGLVGNSNSPVSGMTIMAVLATGLLILLFGFGGLQGQTAILIVAGVVCCVACTSGDVCNDLKTGNLVGASPRLQQIMQVVGVVAAAFVLCPVLTVLHSTYTVGSKELPAPQAGLFASLAQGLSPVTEEPTAGQADVAGNADGVSAPPADNGADDKAVAKPQAQIPMNLIWIGAGIGLALLAIDFFLGLAKSSFRLYVMPVAVGIYLPFGVAPPMLLGGILSWLILRKKDGKGLADEHAGVLAASGIIAGESLMGVGVGFVAFFGLTLPKLADRIAESAGHWLVNAYTIAIFLGSAIALYLLAGTEPRNDRGK